MRTAEDCEAQYMYGMRLAGESWQKLSRVLLELRAAVDALDDDEWTPLCLAADAGHVGACRALVEGGADFDHTEDISSFI